MISEGSYDTEDTRIHYFLIYIKMENNYLIFYKILHFYCIKIACIIISGVI